MLISIIRATFVLTTGIISAYVDTYRMNASKEIKTSNKILASMQLSKMTAKTGLKGDKSLPTMKRSPALDAYIVGATSYNITDATNTANQLAVSTKKKHLENTMIVTGAIGAIISVITTNYLISIVIVVIVIITLVFKHIKPEQTTILIMGMSTASIVGTTMSIILVLLEMSKPNSDTDVLRKLIYTVILCLTTV